MNDRWKKFETAKVAAVQMDAYAEGREKEMVAYIDLKTLRWRRANSRTLHQRRPEVYGEIVENHKPWLIYEEETNLPLGEMKLLCRDKTDRQDR